jgi:hypothetical protein
MVFPEEFIVTHVVGTFPGSVAVVAFEFSSDPNESSLPLNILFCQMVLFRPDFFVHFFQDALHMRISCLSFDLMTAIMPLLKILLTFS